MKSSIAKKVIIILLLSFLTQVGVYAQESAFKKFETNSDVQYMDIGPEILNNLGGFDFNVAGLANDKNFSEEFKKVKNVKLYVTEETKTGKELIQTVRDFIKKNKFESILSVSEGNEKVEIYAEDSDPKLNESILHLIVQNDDKEDSNYIYICLKGSFDLTKFIN